MTQSPSCISKSLPSIKGKKSMGAIIPFSGWNHRIKASAPNTLPVLILTLGW